MGENEKSDKNLPQAAPKLLLQSTFHGQFDFLREFWNPLGSRGRFPFPSFPQKICTKPKKKKKNLFKWNYCSWNLEIFIKNWTKKSWISYLKKHKNGPKGFKKIRFKGHKINFLRWAHLILLPNLISNKISHLISVKRINWGLWPLK